MTYLPLNRELREFLEKSADAAGLKFQVVTLQSEQIMKVRTDDPDPIWLEVGEKDDGRPLSFCYKGYRERKLLDAAESGQLEYEPARHAFRLTYDGAEGEQVLSPSQIAELLVASLLDK